MGRLRRLANSSAGIWLLLARFDKNELQKPQKEPKKIIKKEKYKGPATSGVGYGGFDFDDDFDYGYVPSHLDVLTISRLGF